MRPNNVLALSISLVLVSSVLVQPTGPARATQAATAGPAQPSFLSAADVKWTDLDPTGAPGVKIADLWGDHAKGGVRWVPEAPRGIRRSAAHTHARHEVVFLSGTYVQAPEGKAEIRLGPCVTCCSLAATTDTSRPATRPRTACSLSKATDRSTSRWSRRRNRPHDSPTVETMTVRTRGRGFYEITREIQTRVQQAGMQTGLCTLHCSTHRVAPYPGERRARRAAGFRAVLRAPGAGRRPALRARRRGPRRHARACPHDPDQGQSESRARGGLRLGTWQGIYLWEHRTAPHTRTVAVHLIGEGDRKSRGELP